MPIAITESPLGGPILLCIVCHCKQLQLLMLLLLNNTQYSLMSDINQVRGLASLHACPLFPGEWLTNKDTMSYGHSSNDSCRLVSLMGVTLVLATLHVLCWQVTAHSIRMCMRPTRLWSNYHFICNVSELIGGVCCFRKNQRGEKGLVQKSLKLTLILNPFSYEFNSVARMTSTLYNGLYCGCRPFFAIHPDNVRLDACWDPCSRCVLNIY